MTDIDRGVIGSADEDRLPWLEAVEDEDGASGVGAGKLIASLLGALVAIGLIVGGIFWLRDRRSEVAGGTGEVIQAPAGDYKVRPAQPGGMKVEGEGDATYAASEGSNVSAPIDISKQPEAPVTAPKQTASAAPATDRVNPAAPTAKAPATPAATKVATPVKQPEAVKPAKPAEVAKAPEAAPVKGGAVQLGAFGTEAKAQDAWKNLAGRFPALKPLSHSVTLVTSGGKTLYRLRAQAGGRAAGVCKALTSAKEPCNIIG